jgi:hypothetical protein
MKSGRILLKYGGLSGDEHLIEKRFAVHCRSLSQTSLVHAGAAVQIPYVLKSAARQEFWEAT